jgi:hypothetical protein
MQGRLTSLLDAANRGLGVLGSPPFTNWETPENAGGIKIKPWLLEAIDEVQGEYLWQEVMTTVTITADATKAFDGRDRFALPADCLRPLGFRFPITTLPESALTKYFSMGENAYEIEGNWLLCYADEIDFVYNKRQDDPTKWTAELGRVIYHCAAVNSGQSITSDAKIVSNVLERYIKLVKPLARLLQAKYRTNAKFLPEGFSYIQSHYTY